nr:EamA family transporter [Microbacterium sp. No. 7]
MAVAASWGSTYWVAKELLEGGDVLGMLSVRMLSTAALLGMLLVIGRRAPSRPSMRLGMIYGLMLSTVFVLETFGIAHTSATNAGLIISLTIVFTPLLEALVTRTRPSRTFVLGSVAALLGIVLLSMNGRLTAPALGDWLILGAAVARAVHVTVVKRSSAQHAVDDLSLTFWQMLTCAGVFTGLAVLTGGSPLRYLSAMDGADSLRMVYLVVVCTVFPFFVQMWAVRRTSASRVSLLLGTEPVYAALIGVTLAGDRLKPIGWIGLGIVLISVLTVQILTTRRSRRSRPGETRRRARRAPAR